LNDVDTSWPIPPADGWLAMILRGFCMSGAMVLHEKWLKGLTQRPTQEGNMDGTHDQSIRLDDHPLP